MKPARLAWLTLLAACATTTPSGETDPAAVDATRPAEPSSEPAVTGRASSAQPKVGRAAVEALDFPPLRFDPPRAERLTLSNGLPVFFMEDHSLPLVDVFAIFRGGPSYFGREDLAAATAVGSSLLLSAGTATLTPDSVDKIVEFYALSPSFGTGGTASFSGIGSLTQHVDVALELWTAMLREPRFDRERVESWRLRELETVRRLDDSPGSIAISEFNRLMFGDDPIGWVMEPADLAPEKLADDRLRRIHREIYCIENTTLGVTGDLTRDEAIRKLEAAFGAWPACPRTLEPPPPPTIRTGGGVRVIHKEVNQSSVVLGHRGGILQRDDPEYYASQIANWILGGSGFSSRVMARIRTERGLAYSAGSVWGAGTRHERIFGAFTQTKSESTIAATRLVRELLREARNEPPTREEVRLAVENTVNGFVFAFERPADIVSRQMAYRAAGMPEDWLERYVAGVQAVTPGSVRDVIRRYIRPDEMLIVIVGDTTKFDHPASVLGPIITR